tara:strand:+ start:337 stop:1122 length:786 start_codon:yes stop_codon:yes gene_type:complete
MGSAEKQGKLWGAAVEDWAELGDPKHQPYWRAMLADMNVSRGTCLLDTGCGAGGGSKMAVELGATVFGLDASEAMISFAQKFVPEGDFRVGELEELPFDDDYFDAVMAANSVQYAENPNNALKEIRRVCKPEGKVSVCTWDVAEKNEMRFLMGAIRDLLPDPPPSGRGPFALAEAGKLEGFVEDAGLRVVSGESVPVVYHFESLEIFIRAQCASGANQIPLSTIGEKDFRQALMDFFEKHKGDDGKLSLNNMFRFVTATPD